NPSSRRSFSGKAVLRFSSGSSSRRWPLIEVAWVSHSVDVSAVMVEFILLSFSSVSRKKPGQDAGGGGRGNGFAHLPPTPEVCLLLVRAVAVSSLARSPHELRVDSLGPGA